MRKILLILAATCLPMSACATPISLQPSTYANKTTLDEQGAITAELAYKSWRLAAETGVQTGLIKGTTAKKVAGIDNILYAALTVVEKAYATGNATTIQQAVSSFNSTLASAYTVIGGK